MLENKLLKQVCCTYTVRQQGVMLKFKTSVFIDTALLLSKPPTYLIDCLQFKSTLVSELVSSGRNFHLVDIPIVTFYANSYL
jgi:hypothetical protein